MPLEMLLKMFATPAMVNMIQGKIGEFIMEVTQQFRTSPSSKVGLMVVPVVESNGAVAAKPQINLDIHVYVDGKSVQKITIAQLLDEMKKEKEKAK